MNTQNINVSEAIRAINYARKLRGHSKIEAARLAEVHQSPANRIMNGHCRRVGKNLLKLCKYANYPDERNAKPNPGSNEILMGALSAAWDGTDEGAHSLAQVLLGIAEIANR